MSRQRRRRVQDNELVKEASEYREEKEKKSSKSEVVFMEEMDYKM